VEGRINAYTKHNRNFEQLVELLGRASLQRIPVVLAACLHGNEVPVVGNKTVWNLI
jgi:hypothetical protein